MLSAIASRQGRHIDGGEGSTSYMDRMTFDGRQADTCLRTHPWSRTYLNIATDTKTQGQLLHGNNEANGQLNIGEPC